MLIRQELLKPHWTLPRARVEIECVHGNKKFCAMGEVPLEIKGKFRQKHVGVVDGLPHSLLLGTDWDSFPAGKPRHIQGPRRVEIKPAEPGKEEINVKGLEEARHEIRNH